MRAVSFDLDGTLVDHQGAVDRALAAVLAELVRTGLASPADLPGLRKRFTVAGAEHKRRADQRGAPWWEIADQLTDAFTPRVPVSRVAGLAATFTRVLHAEPRAYPEVPAVVAATARTLPVAVLTNGDPATQHGKLRRTGLDGYLTVVIASGATGHHKPDPAVFADLCARLDLPPTEVLHVGDDPEHDVRGGLRAGLPVVWLNRTGRPRPPWLPARVPELPDLTDLITLLSAVAA